MANSALGQTICIDPGHPSEVGRGTQSSPTSSPVITEIHAAWVVGQKLKVKLEDLGYQVVFTKATEETFVENRDRAKVANDNHAALMVRLHCDASDGSGFTVYYPDRQGKNGDKTGPTWSVIHASSRAAESFYGAMLQALKGKLPSEGLKPDTKTAVGSKQGALTGSIFSEVPVLLVEMCVLTNKKDAAWIASEEGQELMAVALAKGVLSAVSINRKPQQHY